MKNYDFLKIGELGLRIRLHFKIDVSRFYFSILLKAEFFPL